jgi:hypothetical protein
VTSDQGKRQDPRELKELWERLRDLNEVKQEEKKSRAKNVKGINLIDCVGVRLQSDVTYTYIGSMT